MMNEKNTQQQQQQNELKASETLILHSVSRSYRKYIQP